MKPLIERLMRRVEKTETCWLWTGATTSGYGVLQRGGKDGGLVRAHRALYEFTVGPIPEGAELLHLCHTPRCVNPDHLKPGTHRENMQMSWRDGRINAARGEKAGKAKLTEEQVISILRDTRKSAVLAQEFGVRRQSIEAIRTGLHWRHLHHYALDTSGR